MHLDTWTNTQLCSAALLTITARRAKLHWIQHLYLVFVVTAGADGFTRALSAFCVCLFCDTLNLSRDTKQPTIPVSLISFNPCPDGSHSMYLDKLDFFAKLRF